MRIGIQQARVAKNSLTKRRSLKRTERMYSKRASRLEAVGGSETVHTTSERARKGDYDPTRRRQVCVTTERNKIGKKGVNEMTKTR